MSITENIRNENRKNRKLILYLFIAGITFLIFIPIILTRILPKIYKLNPPKYLEIEIPESTEVVNTSKLDSVLSAYLLNQDSVVLDYKTEIKITNLKNVDSFFVKKNFKYLLIKSSPDAGYNSLVTILDKIKEANINKYVIVDFNQNELDSILLTKK